MMAFTIDNPERGNFMDLVIPIRIKKDKVQFTVELDLADRNELMQLAKDRNLKFHTLVKAILLSYLKYVKEY